MHLTLVKTRRTDKADIPSLLKLYRQEYPVVKEHIFTAFFESLSRMPTYQILAAVYSSEIIGFIAMQRRVSLQTMQELLNVELLLVDRRYRGNKVGKVLLAAAQAWSSENGLADIEVQVPEGFLHLVAHDFLSRSDYRPRAVLYGYAGPRLPPG